MEGEPSIAGNLCLQYIANFFYCLRFLPCRLIYFLYACVHDYYFFIQYWILLPGFGWIEMALCPHHAQTKVMIMTLLWSLCVVVVMQQQLLVFESISMVVLEEVSTCIICDEVVIIVLRD